jgi:hypothetical protein
LGNRSRAGASNIPSPTGKNIFINIVADLSWKTKEGCS